MRVTQWRWDKTLPSSGTKTAHYTAGWIANTDGVHPTQAAGAAQAASAADHRETSGAAVFDAAHLPTEVQSDPFGTANDRNRETACVG